jgi:hypothetical protein
MGALSLRLIKKKSGRSNVGQVFLASRPMQG